MTSLINSGYAFFSLEYTRALYESDKTAVNPLSGRTFAAWTILSGFVRLYAAFNINNKQLYQLAFLTYMLAWTHFIVEWRIFESATWNRRLAGPTTVSTISMIWMWVTWNDYVG